MDTPKQNPPHICPRCYWDVGSKPDATPEEDQRREYIRCLLGNNTYKKSYALFDGQVNLSYRALNMAESSIMGKALRSLDAEDKESKAMEVLKLKLLFHLKQHNDTEYDSITTTDLAELNQLYDERFGGMSEDFVSVLIRTLMEFTKLVSLLADSGFDENFWKGAGLG